MTALLKTEHEIKVLDIDEAISEIKSMFEGKKLLTSEGLPFFGDITIYFKDGVYKNYRRNEVGF